MRRLACPRPRDRASVCLLDERYNSRAECNDMKGGRMASIVRQVSVARRVLATWLTAMALVPAVAVPLAAQNGGEAPRTAWGAPDLQGVWDFRTLTPMQRPSSQADRGFLTEEEAAHRRQAELDRLDRLDHKGADEAEVGGILDRGRGEDGEPGSYNQFWFDRGTSVAATKRTSLIVDPPNGRMPPLTEEEKQRRAALAELRQDVTDHEPTPGGWVEEIGPAHLMARCILGFNAGPPMTPGSYNNNMQVFQTEDTVVIFTEMVHNARIIPLDGRSPLPFRQYSGESQARWDGDTLRVTTSNFRHPTMFLRGRSSRDLYLTERFARISPEVLLYQATINDPDTWTRPWTYEVPMQRNPDPIYEYACHEGNYGLYNILAAAAVRDIRANAASR